MSPTRYRLKLFILVLFIFASLPFLIPASAFLTASEAAGAAAPPDVLADEATDKNEFFEKHVRPLLAANCYGCHTESQSGGLRLDSRQSILKGGNRGPAIVPGRPAESLLIKVVGHTDPHLRMPQGGAKLKDEEIAYLTNWVKDGAHWPETPEEFFQARVRPVLESSCLACHNGDSAMSGLRLDSREKMLKGGASGPAVVPGDPDKSLLIQAVRYTHARFKMPMGKQLPEQQIADLVHWVKAGAAWSDKAGAVASTSGEYVVTPEQKAFWSFQSLKDSLVPPVKLRSWPKQPIDNFILAKLEEKKLTPTLPADKRTLIRRATFDLTGLPPTPEEVEAFLVDTSPNAFARVVDRLLASPAYGERWGRHWLDLVRYSDSAGDSADYPVPQAYLYRNYVIDAFNQDKPYDQFLSEQIAGDLLPGKTENEKWERTVATGYLAIARRFSVRPERNMYLTIDDTIDNLSKATLGLTVGCARCHDHKYDPIPTKDYYALFGIFDSTRYPFAGSENVQQQRDLVYRLPKEKTDAVLKPYLERLAPIDAELKKLGEEKKNFEEADEAQAVAVADSSTAAAPRRTLKQINAEINEVKKRRVPIAAQAPPLEKAYAVAEGEGHNARVLKRGDPKNLGDEVPRRFLQILGGHNLPPVKEGSGRLQLAQWLTDPKNPLTARVMVNRIWQHHFGKGIVQTPSDFGKRGKPPTHPELLDYLAERFIESRWSVKAMHRMIMLSQVYQLASQGQSQNAQTDPTNDLLWRFNRRRLDAEALRDALLAISGELDKTRGAAHPFPHESTWNYTQHKPFAIVYEAKQRSVYLMNQRIQKHPYLAIFDGADANASTAERTSSTTPIQALYMMNSLFVHEQADSLAKRLMSEAGENHQRIDLAYRVVLGRPATSEEIEQAQNYLQQSQQKLLAAEVAAEQQPRQSLASYLRVLLSSNEFMFVD